MAVSKSSPPSKLLDGLREFLATRLPDQAAVCVGLSGGRDSVVLLHALSRLLPAERLAAIHVNHNLSPKAGQWAAFCENICRSLSITCQVVSVVVGERSGSGLEAAARAARYGAFAGVSAEYLALAHHAGDQAETVLFNLLRGSGVAGLAAMAPERSWQGKKILRPLLGVSGADIQAAAEAWQLAWVDDESNRDTDFSRNFLRHEILPLVSGRFPGAEAALGRTAAYCGEAELLLGELAEMDWVALSDGEGVPMGRLATLSVPRLKNLLRHRLRQLAWRVPVADRLEEFSRQLLSAAPDRHPALKLPEGWMRVRGRRLRWDAE